MPESLGVVRLGTVDYAEALALQRRAAAARAEDCIPDLLLLLEHPHVYTLGRAARPEHVRASAAEMAAVGATVHAVERGGDVTYHGPGQLVGYPILDLRRHGQDLHRYLRLIEQALIDALTSFGVCAGRVAGLTGVWIGDEKVAAIGVGVRRWVTLHGFALNVAVDLSYFDLIVPCGIHDRGVTSLHRHLVPPPSLDDVADRVSGTFAECFDLTPFSVSSLEPLLNGVPPATSVFSRSLQNGCLHADN
jgi:lipoyl(octanoyl) transferase